MDKKVIMETRDFTLFSDRTAVYKGVEMYLEDIWVDGAIKLRLKLKNN